MILNDIFWIPVPKPEDVPIVLNTALLADGWNPGASNIGQKLITGNENRKESDSSFDWDYNFELTLRWAPETQQDYAQQLRLQTVPSSTNLLSDAHEAELATYLPDQQGHIVFIQLKDKKTQSDHKLRERAAYLKSALITEAKIFLVTGHPKANPDVYPSARFATTDELNAKGFLAPFDNHRRFIVSKIGDRFLSIPPRQASRHVLVSGPTGTGKSRSIFGPNLIERTQTSMIVTEATAGNEQPHLYQATAGWREANGHTILYFNPDDLSSDRINPLDMIQTDRDARMVCELIMKTTTQKSHRGDQFWDTSERMLLTALILHVCGFREEGVAHLSHVVELVNRSESELKRIGRRSPVQQAYDRFEAFFSRGTENTRSIVLSCLGQRLDLWNDTRTRVLTSKTTIDITQLRDQLFTFYLVLSAEKEEFKPLAILVWHFIMHLLTNNRFKYPLTLMLDEFANLGYIRGMKEKLSLFRHQDIGVVLGVQDFDQIDIVYEKEATLFRTQPATKLFLTPNELDKAKPISDMLGQTTLIDPEVQGGNVKYQKIQRALLNPEEILNPRFDDQLIVFLPSCRAAHIKHIPWLEYDSYAENYPPPVREALEIDEGLKFRMLDYPLAPGDAPWDPMDEDAADVEKNKRATGQVAADISQEKNFQKSEQNRHAEEQKDAQAEIERLAYYNSVKAHLAKEIEGIDKARSLLAQFEENLLLLLAQNKGRTLSNDEKEKQAGAELKVQIMKDVVTDMEANTLPKDPGNDYPLPWQN